MTQYLMPFRVCPIINSNTLSFVRKECIRRTTLELISWLCNLLISLICGILTNALSKSVNITSICLSFSNASILLSNFFHTGLDFPL
jgi:hypothetical protein